jgi:chemotaxis protein MotB
MVTQAASRRRVVKKKVGGHGHHGGAWKVAYADFVTAMMALFMIMWLLASTDAKAREEISQYFRTGILPEGSMAMNDAAQLTPSVIERAPSPPRRESLEDRVAELKAEIEDMAKINESLAAVAKHVEITITDRGVLLEIVDDENGDLLFDSASSDLKPALAAFLGQLAPTLGAAGTDIEINGHTDARPFVAGAAMTNWDLSYERASVARTILETHGVVPAQITGVIGRAASQLYDPAHPDSARNRRLSILLIYPQAPRAA